ncbi:MAG: TRAP transporter small permease [Burkholderiales bacterium]|nr:TRAP transporter small permease [Burkholderiales bacterium]
MRGALSRLCAAIDRLNEWGAWFAAACCAVLAVMLIVEVGVTSKLGWSQPWAVEYASYLCAVTLLGGAGFALRHSSHIRVAVALEYLPRPLVRVLDFFCTLGALAVTGILAYGFWELAAKSLERGSKSYFVMQTPLWIPQGLLAVGVFLLLAALVARAIRILIGEAPDLAEERAAGEGGAE